MTTTTAPKNAEATDVLTRWYQAWNAHDLDAVSALITDDFRLEDPAAHAAVLVGRPTVEEYVRAAFHAIPDMHLEQIEHWVSPGDEVVVSYFRMTGTLTGAVESPGLPPLAPTNGSINLLGMDRSEIQADRLSRHQIFWDAVEFGRQVGALPPRGSALEKLSRRMQHLTARGMRRRS